MSAKSRVLTIVVDGTAEPPAGVIEAKLRIHATVSGQPSPPPSTPPRKRPGQSLNDQLRRLIRLGRAYAGMTQPMLARRAGLNFWRLSHIERGIVTPHPDEIAKIARALAFPPLLWVVGASNKQQDSQPACGAER